MKIAVLEDDPHQCALLRLWLESAGHDVWTETDPRRFLEQIRPGEYALLILDWRLPELSGLEVLQILRERDQLTEPVVFLTANDSEDAVVAALNAGADDYIVKPAVREIFLARVSAILRRVPGTVVPGDDATDFPPYSFDRSASAVRFDGEEVRLTTREFELALFFFRNAGRLLSRDFLLRRIWSVNDRVQTRTLDTHVSRLRNKLDLNAERGWQLNSVYGYGYRLEQSAMAKRAAAAAAAEKGQG